MKFFLSFFILLFISDISPSPETENTIYEHKAKNALKTSFSFKKGILQLQIQNMHPPKGAIKIALFKGEDTFLDDNAAFRTASVEVQGSQVVETTFSDLPYSVYAAAIYHDINGNGQLDKNFVGVPKEPYGFSNNAKSKWGPPNYEIAKFSIDQPTVEMQIAVKKWSDW